MPSAFPLCGRNIVSGETYRYLGRQYRLFLKQGVGESVKLMHGLIVIASVNPENADNVKALLDYWLRSKTLTVFAERYHVCVQLVAKLGIKVFKSALCQHK